MIESGGIGAKIKAQNDTQILGQNVVKMQTLDSFVSERKLKVGFIKVDIEGAELDFLLGAKQTICTQKPAILLSIYHKSEDFWGLKPLIESWNLGYSFKIIKPVDFTIAVETALYCEIL